MVALWLNQAGRIYAFADGTVYCLIGQLGQAHRIAVIRVSEAFPTFEGRATSASWAGTGQENWADGRKPKGAGRAGNQAFRSLFIAMSVQMR